MTNTWTAYLEGSTLGTIGSEEGTIISDEDYNQEARITLEKNVRNIPFAITCGIYGWMVHTRYFGDETEAQQAFNEMKDELARIVALIPYNSDPELETRERLLVDELKEFIKRFP